MRRTYFSPEFTNNLVNGSLNVLEQSNFFSSKMLEIEDNIIIDNIDILWYDNNNGEQLDLSIESVNLPYVYSPSDDKFNNLKLSIDEYSTPKGVNSKNTKWIFEINLKSILSNYLFSTLKKYRTFEGVRNNSTIYNDVNVFINNYIKSNILNRYKLEKIDLFILNRSIGEDSQIKYKNNWNKNISVDALVKNYQITFNNDESIAKILFLQLNSNEYIFDYYYNIHYKKI